MITITKEEYFSDPAKYLKISTGDEQVQVLDGQEVVATLGWGKLPPPTVEELKAVDVSDMPEPSGPCSSHWLE